MCKSGIRGGKAIIDSELEESFNDEGLDSADSTESRIVQYATGSSSALIAIRGRTKTTWEATEAGGGLTSTFACFPFAIGDGAAAGLFAPVLILSTPALYAVTAVLDTAVTEGTTALGETLVLGATPAFDTFIAWVAFDASTLVPFGATYPFAGITFVGGHKMHIFTANIRTFHSRYRR
jgi:hypothetical protein